MEGSSSMTLRLLGGRSPALWVPQEETALPQEGRGGVGAQGPLQLPSRGARCFSLHWPLFLSSRFLQIHCMQTPLELHVPSAWGSVSQHIWSQEHPWPWGTGRQGDPSIANPSEVCFHEHNTGPSIGWHWLPSRGVGSGLSLLCPKPPSDPTKVPSVG